MACEISIAPAYASLSRAVDELRAGAFSGDGVSQLPDGAEYYQHTLRHHTTLDLTADQVHQLGLEEEAVGEAIEILQRVRELTLQANNGTASEADRHIIAVELAEHRAALLGIANTTDVDGRYLFGGYSEATTPFTVSQSGSVVYNGDQGQRT